MLRPRRRPIFKRAGRRMRALRPLLLALLPSLAWSAQAEAPAPGPSPVLASVFPPVAEAQARMAGVLRHDGGPSAVLSLGHQ